MNVAFVRSRFVIMPGSFTGTLAVSNNDDEDITIPGCQRAPYEQSDVINYGGVMDNAERTVFLLPCQNVVNASGEAVTPRPDNLFTDSAGDVWSVLAVTQTLKNTWWRCPASKTTR